LINHEDDIDDDVFTILSICESSGSLSSISNLTFPTI